MAVFPDSKQIVIHRESYFSAEWYYTEAGHLPAWAFYKELGKMDQQRFDLAIRYYCDNRPGTMLPRTLYRLEDSVNKIYAFKPGAFRFFNFMSISSKVTVTNAYRKHSEKMTRQDLEILKVAARYREDLKRVQEGTYYEN